MHRAPRSRTAEKTSNIDRGWALSATYLATITILLHQSWLVRHFQMDDAFIYLRYVQNAIDGNGLVFNVGERFNGLTSPLYAYLLVALAWLSGNAQAAASKVCSF